MKTATSEMVGCEKNVKTTHARLELLLTVDLEHLFILLFAEELPVERPPSACTPLGFALHRHNNQHYSFTPDHQTETFFFCFCSEFCTAYSRKDSRGRREQC